MIGESDLELGALRLLEVDNRVRLPIETEVRIIVTSGDERSNDCYNHEGGLTGGNRNEEETI